MPDPNEGPGTAPTAVATPPATPVASGTPGPTPTPETPAGEQLMQVQREQFRDDGYDYTRTVKNSKQFREAEESGLNALGQYIGAQTNRVTGAPVTPKEMLEALQAQQDEPAPPDEPAITPLTEAPLTESRMQQLLADRDTATKETADRQTEKRAWDKEDEFAAKAIERMGVPKDDYRHRRLLSVFKDVVKEQIESSIPSYLNDAQKADLSNTPATEAQLAAAMEPFTTFCKDFGMEAVADFANEQGTVPGATLGTGAGGRGPGRKYSSLTQDEQNAAIEGEEGFEDVLPDE